MGEKSLAKKCKFNRIMLIITFTITMAALVGVLVSTFDYYRDELRYNKMRMESLPIGSLQGAYVSPNKKYTLKAYVCSKGESVDWAARCELINNSSGKSKNIYWDYRIERMKVNWISEYTININGHYIDVRHDVYDWREA